MTKYFSNTLFIIIASLFTTKDEAQTVIDSKYEILITAPYQDVIKQLKGIKFWDQWLEYIEDTSLVGLDSQIISYNSGSTQLYNSKQLNLKQKQKYIINFDFVNKSLAEKKNISLSFRITKRKNDLTVCTLYCKYKNWLDTNQKENNYKLIISILNRLRSSTHEMYCDKIENLDKSL